MSTSKNIPKLNNEELLELDIIATDYIEKGLRIGQSYMVALSKVRMELYDLITATEFDCFYVDSKIPAFFQFIKEKPE